MVVNNVSLFKRLILILTNTCPCVNNLTTAYDESTWGPGVESKSKL